MSARVRIALSCVFGAMLSPPMAAGQELACRLDDALSQAAAELLLARAKLDGPQLTAAVRNAGSDALALHALLVPPDRPGALETWLADLRARSDAELICGRADDGRGQLVIASASGGSLAPIDPERRIVRGSLAKGFDRAELVVAAGDGSLTRVGASAAVLAHGIAIEPDLPMPIHVQLVARGSSGPRPIAERVIGAVSDANDESAHRSDSTAPNATTDELAPLLIALRRERGRPPLRDNRLLRRAATAYAGDVCREGRVAHELERGQGPEQRLASVGLSARLVGETIARASDASRALQALVQSPSHLLTLLEPRFTDVGVGRASDGMGKSCFVVLLSAWPRYIGH